MNVRPLAAALYVAFFPLVAHGQVAVKGDAAKAQQIVTQVCAACHGADGNSAIPANPVIAGQHSWYAFKQLTNFKSQGGKPAERPSPVMGAIVSGLSRDDMANLALYYSSQKTTTRTARNPELVKLGEAIYRGGVIKKGVAACSSCHGPSGAGVPAQFPRLAGQHAQYTLEELKQFRAGERQNDPGRMMQLIAGKLSDQEMAAVAQFIEGLR